MALKYTADFLLSLRDSPLCAKPENFPPADEWMGPLPDQQPRAPHQQSRNGQGLPMGAFEKPRHGDNTSQDQANRRPDLNRHASRNSATNPDEIVFGPPRMSFTSSGRNKGFENDRLQRDGEGLGRFNNFRNRSGDLDGDRFRDGRNANPLRRRGEAAEQDGDGWSTVKPRKSFGAEGAERFHGRMGGSFRDEKRQPRDREERPGRQFDTFAKERDAEDEGRPRNGQAKGKTESWHKSEGSEGRVPERRERIDRTKNWRERIPETDAEDQGAGRSNDSRRWGREQRSEREPEWFDDPAEPKFEPHTQQDFQKWMEEMKKTQGGQPATASQPATVMSDPAIEEAKPSVRSPPAIEAGPDKFFMAFGQSSASVPDTATPAEHKEAERPKPAGKSSRFTSFFQAQGSGKPEQAVPAVPMPAPPAAPSSEGNPLAFLSNPSIGGSQGPNEEKQAFQQLLAKLQKQSVSATPPGPSPFAAPTPSSATDSGQRVGPSPFQHVRGGERQDGPQGSRPPPQHIQEILAPRPQQQSARPEQLLQDLVGHHQRVSSQGSAHGEANPSRNNSNMEFLINLMRAGPDSQRSESAMMRAAQQAHKQGPMAQPAEREVDFPQESRSAHRQMRPMPPPGFPLDDGFRAGEPDFRQSQPTQILQRPPPPPGLEQMPPGWMGGQMPPPPPQQQPPHQQPQQQRGPMIPPPGLGAGPGRNGPMPTPHMFPPNMQPLPHPEAMGSMPPRNMGPPPPGFFNGPPHGFIHPGMGGFNGPPGPESPFVGSPFEGRGMPPPAGGRGGNFGRG